ncbi:helix-turn-helix transcriptional regulator [Nocardia africana]
MAEPNQPKTPESLWDIEDLARFLKIQPGTIYKWRARGYGPRPVRNGEMGNHLRWHPATVMEWLAEPGDEAA